MFRNVTARILVAAGWAAAFVFTLATYELTNDQFGRISPGWQWATFGDLPFRDFLDPGYFLTELATAALQHLFGPQLLGEMLLNVVFIATGTALVLSLASRASGSAVIGATAAALALLSMPRAYDYDKVLFYPLGVSLCWRYIDQPSRRNLTWLAIGIVVAGLFRYDNGVFIGCAAVVGLIVRHAGDRRMLTRELGVLMVIALGIAAPWLVWLEWRSGLLNTVDQLWTYAMREGARTRIESRPAFVMGDLIAIDPVQRGAIQITWSPAVGVGARRTLSEQYQLHDEVPEGSPELRTWSYTVADPSTDNLRRLMGDPFVEHTQFLESGAYTLSVPESLRSRIRRTLPLDRLRLLPGLRDIRNGSAFLYYLLTWLPVAAAVLVVLRRRSTADEARIERARVAALLTLCLTLNVLILRDPVGARIGGMAGPAAIAFAWLAGHLSGGRLRDRLDASTRWSSVRRWTARVAVGLVLMCVVASLSTVAEWNRRLLFNESVVARLARITTVMAAAPPLITTITNPGLWDLVAYLRDCTAPSDRIFAPAFLPELYFFAQRGFAGGVVATFGDHWSEPRFERRILETLSSQSVPVVVFESADPQSLAASYPALSRHLSQRYVRAGAFTFDAPGAHPYEVFVERNRQPVRVHERFSLPCFAPR